MSRREWIARSRSLVAAVVLLAVPLATDTRSDQDQTVPGASAAGAPVPLPPELARYGGGRAQPFLRSYHPPGTITLPRSPLPPHGRQGRGRGADEFYPLLGKGEGGTLLAERRARRLSPPAARHA